MYQALYYVHMFLFLHFVKSTCHSTSSDASDAYVVACLVAVDVHTHAFLCSSKAYVIVQVVTQVTLMSLKLNEVDEHSA